jgi:hypothetical protein
LKHPHKGSHAPRPGGHHPHTMVKHPAAPGARHHVATGKPHNTWGKNAHHGWPHHKGPISARAKLARLGKKHPHKGSHRPRPGGHHHHTGSHKPQRHKGTLHKQRVHTHPRKGGNHHAHQNRAKSVIAMKTLSTRVGKKHPHKGGHKGIITSRRIQSRGRQPNVSITPNQARTISRPHHHKGRHGRYTMSGKYTGVSTLITVPVHRLIIQGLRPPKPHKAVWVNHRSKHWNHKRGHRKRSW